MKLPIFSTLKSVSIAIVTLLVMNFIIVQPLRRDLKEISMKLIEQPTYSIQNDFEKMRTKKNGTINLDLKNELTHNDFRADSMTIDSTKKTFLKKLFNRKK